MSDRIKVEPHPDAQGTAEIEPAWGYDAHALALAWLLLVSWTAYFLLRGHVA